MNPASPSLDRNDAETSLWSRKRELLALLVMVFIYFFSFFQRTAVPGTIFNQLQTDMSLTATGVTALGAMMIYIYATAQIFVGILADRFGGGRVLVAGGLVLALGSIAFPLAQEPWLLYLARAVTGLGAAFMYLSIVKEIDVLMGPRHFPTLIGPTLFIGYSGGLVATAPFDWAARNFGWRQSLLVVGMATLVCVVLTALVLRRLRHLVSEGKGVSLRPLWGILRNRRCWPLWIWACISFPIYFTFQSSVGKKFLEDVAGMSSAGAARVLFLMVALGIGLAFFNGVFLRFTSHRRRPHLIASAAVALVAMALMWAGVVTNAPAWLFVVGCMTLAVSMALGTPAVTVMKELNSRDEVAQAVSVMNFIVYLGVAMIANLSGIVLDRFAADVTVSTERTIYPPVAYATLLAVLACLALICLIASFRIPETIGESGPPEEKLSG